MKKENFFNHRLKLYPKDTKYLNLLAKEIGVSDISKIASIMGEQELKYYLNQAQYENFLGNAPYRANLHTHTSVSDGQMKPSEYLDVLLNYIEKNNIKKMLVAVTDHDSIEALPIILKKLALHPEKYQNIRLVLGCELSSAYFDSDLNCPADFELLYYGLNPFDKNLKKMLSSITSNRKKALLPIVKTLCEQYPNVPIDIKEIQQINQNIRKGLGVNLTYDIYKYMESKIDVSQRKSLFSYLFNIGGPNSEEKTLKIFNFIDDLMRVVKKSNLGFVSMAHPPKLCLDGKLSDVFIWNTKAAGRDPGQVFALELLRFLKMNGVTGLEIFYGNFPHALNEAFNNVLFQRNSEGSSEKWVQNFINFANEHHMIKTGGYDNHGFDFGTSQ